MSKAKLIQKSTISSLNKYYTITKILLTITPFVALMYLSMQSIKFGTSFMDLIRLEPRFNILFLVSMINPFIAYLLIFIQRKIEEEDISYAVVNIVIFILSEILLQNILYVALFVFLLYKTLKTYNITIKDSFKDKFKNKFLMTISGSLVVFGLACICLFATIRINM